MSKINVSEILQSHGQRLVNMYHNREVLKLAIKEIINAVIDECAEEAETKSQNEFSDDIGNYEIQVVDKESILKIKQEIDYS